MTAEAQVVIFGAVPVFAAGWFARGFYDSITKETRMATPTTRRFTLFDRIFDWFSHGNRLVGLVVFCVLLGVSALAYTFTADQQSENRSDDVISCIARYVRNTSDAQAPRTEASVRAQDARRDWDQGFSKEMPGATKDELKIRYLQLYAEYEKVRAGNPLPAFTREFCKASAS